MKPMIFALNTRPMANDTMTRRTTLENAAVASMTNTRRSKRGTTDRSMARHVASATMAAKPAGESNQSACAYPY